MEVEKQIRSYLVNDEGVMHLRAQLYVGFNTIIVCSISTPIAKSNNAFRVIVRRLTEIWRL